MLWLIDNVLDYERGNITTVLSAVTFKCSEIFGSQWSMATVQFTFNAIIPVVLSWLIADGYNQCDINLNEWQGILIDGEFD
jgi:hypothetical protein